MPPLMENVFSPLRKFFHCKNIRKCEELLFFTVRKMLELRKDTHEVVLLRPLDREALLNVFTADGKPVISVDFMVRCNVTAASATSTASAASGKDGTGSSTSKIVRRFRKRLSLIVKDVDDNSPFPQENHLLVNLTHNSLKAVRNYLLSNIDFILKKTFFSGRRVEYKQESLL